MLYSIVGILVIIIDQAVKFWVQNTLFGTDIVKFIPGVISLVNVHNDGAAFGILSGSNARIYFVIVTGVFCLLVVLALATNFVSGRLARWSLVMVAAGGVGNMIDRIIYGYVQDMFKVELFNFAIFNVADIFITVFAILFAIAMILEKPDEDFDDELYEDDVEEDDYEEDEKPARKPLMGKLKEKRKEARSASKKSRQEKYEREYEEYRAKQLDAMNMRSTDKTSSVDDDNVKAIRKARKAPEAPPAVKAEPKPESRRPVKKARPEEDPFAAWEKASAKHESERSANFAEKAMGTGVRPSQPQRPVQRPVVEKPLPVKEAAAAVEVEAPKAAPVQSQAAPAQPKPAAKPSSDFNLDDILAEFK